MVTFFGWLLARLTLNGVRGDFSALVKLSNDEYREFYPLDRYRRAVHVSSEDLPPVSSCAYP